MRVSELSHLSGVSLPTIKYYIREGLLPPGTASGPQRSEYGDAHLARLRLLRALIESGGVGIAGAKRITAVLDEDAPPAYAFEVAQDVVSANVDSEAPASADSLERVRARVGVEYCEHPAVRTAARALDALELSSGGMTPAWLEAYARAAEIVASADLDELEARTSVSEQTSIAAVGTALGDVVLQSMRRVAQARETQRRFGKSQHPAPASEDSATHDSAEAAR
ncbi:MerR family transcriptional regulator [Rathayibacter sp. VKM Ac-2856]|uniref:MerR family transcriptional regulator n=1 Tax=unclassified Rathayibacter TaxID=2609250 RepID=UPI001564879E|nr:MULTISPECIES: MerR family transcriptional regulator [unclassified Rathayibacter]NQX03701.1 MerR family transcriptional regulator [Rathayibacter sp. VKM Ac-2858]NQX18869.1 MerR family transcriptional regulator [Rathayibacter sp. VKM Ac-2856]